MKTSVFKPASFNKHHQPVHGDHFVHFFDKADSLVQVFCNYAIPGINRGEGIIVIASKVHQKAFTDGLIHRSIDVNRVISRGQLLIVDAHELLSLFMHKSRPDKTKLVSVVSKLLTGMKQKYSSIRAYGEMVNILTMEGNHIAALELEKIWHEMVEKEPVSLFCGYSADVLYETELSFHDVCSCHSHVVVSDGVFKVS
ncbi:MEDS domain-containing protein [Peredibacter sp. HCB2-198]|uniref:MEDS domain-containing protein n=1 Tax=Peredibacter sp. HCB2-198 TaxID=3383025 RepID=UPI0038B534DE